MLTCVQNDIRYEKVCLSTREDYYSSQVLLFKTPCELRNKKTNIDAHYIITFLHIALLYDHRDVNIFNDSKCEHVFMLDLSLTSIYSQQFRYVRISN